DQAVADAPAMAEPRPTPPALQSTPEIQPSTRPSIPSNDLISSAPYTALLEEARAARSAGELLTPANDSALDLYTEVRLQAAGNPDVEAEFDAVINQVLGIAENAILAGNADQADFALERATAADPGNSRIAFLRAQVNELLLRDRADRARVAIRENRFEDAGRLISEARAFANADTGEIDLLSEELNAARSRQQVGETIATANLRLEAGNLVTPVNDNARYYFELALLNDPGNQAAEQGLITIASKLVLQARNAIDSGDLDRAESLLDDAALLDPSGTDLAVTETALVNARDAIAEAARRAELERAAEIERQAELRRQEEERLQAQAAQRERERIAEQQRQAAAAEQAESQSVIKANEVATGSPLGVGAAAPKQAPPPTATASSSRSSPTTSEPTREPQPVARNNVQLQNETTTVVIPPVRQQAPPQQVQTQSASAINVQNSGNIGATPAEPEMLPISRFERINYVAPEYPRAARRRNITGAVDLTFTITTDGRVRSVSVLKSEPGETFNAAAMNAVEQWRFEPVIENGIAVEKRTAVRMAFDLN
ncbi:MAG: TonB family protein, partial [Gammaproteobacteria bacterium]|nr:TonB family protein [Gammaproteobacteria bacterium]